MILLLLKKQQQQLQRQLSLLSLIPRFLGSKPHTTTNTHLLPQLRCLSNSAIENPPPKTDFAVDYLTRSLGFSSGSATRAARYLTNLESPQKPDLVVAFFKSHGFDDAQITRLIRWYPKLLRANVEKTLEPNFRALIDEEVFGDRLKEFVLCNPSALVLRSTIPRIRFWRTLLGNNDRDLLLAFTRNRGLIVKNTVKDITPKIALLQKHGLSDHEVKMTVVLSTGFIMRNPASVESLLNWAMELGFRPRTRMFVYGLVSLSCTTKARLKAKMKLFKSYGWSESEILCAFQKAPTISHLSDENVRKKLNFLVGRAGCTPTYMASRPILMTYSLEKRLIPRHHVMQILKSKVRAMKEWDYYRTMSCSEEKFVKFIDGYKDKVPKLLKDYIAASTGRVEL